jgi:hypothetical protein
LLNFQQRLSLRSPHCINPSFFQIATFRPISIPVDRDFESSPRTNAVLEYLVKRELSCSTTSACSTFN